MEQGRRASRGHSRGDRSAGGNDSPKAFDLGQCAASPSEGRARGGRSFGHRDREAAFPFAGAQSARRPVAFFESDGGRQPSLRVGGRAGRASCGLPRWVDRERCAAPFRATFVQVQLATYLAGGRRKGTGKAQAPNLKGGT